MSRFHQDPKFPKSRMRGSVVSTPETREATRRRDERLFNDLVAGTDGLPTGRTGGEVIPSYRQADPRVCFYAALLAIRNAHASRKFDADDEARVTADAEDRELLGPYGAETRRGYAEQQTGFIQGSFHLRVYFVDQSDLGIASELSGALQNDRQVVFGRAAPAGGSGVGHWIGLDGINRQPTGDIGFTGMDPASGQRIELAPEAVHEDLLKFALPLVVVEGYAPRFTASNPALPPAAQSLFRPQGGDF